MHSHTHPHTRMHTGRHACEQHDVGDRLSAHTYRLLAAFRSEFPLTTPAGLGDHLPALTTRSGMALALAGVLTTTQRFVTAAATRRRGLVAWQRH